MEESLAITLDKYGINAFILLFISQCLEHDQRNFKKIKRILFSLTLKLPWQELGNRQGGRHDFAGGAVKHPDALSSNLVFLLSWKKMSHHVQCSGYVHRQAFTELLLAFAKEIPILFRGTEESIQQCLQSGKFRKSSVKNEVVFVFAFCVCVCDQIILKRLHSVLLE